MGVGLAPLLRVQVVIITVTLVLEDFQFLPVGRYQPAGHAQIARYPFSWLSAFCNSVLVAATSVFTPPTSVLTE